MRQAGPAKATAPIPRLAIAAAGARLPKLGGEPAHHACGLRSQADSRPGCVSASLPGPVRAAGAR